jgi:hypothetical protein
MVPLASQDPGAPRRPTITLPHNNPAAQTRPPDKAVYTHIDAWDAAWEADWLRDHAFDNPTITEHAYGAGVITHREYLAATHEAFLAHVDAVLLASVRETLTVGQALWLIERGTVDELAGRRAA